MGFLDEAGICRQTIGVDYNGNISKRFIIPLAFFPCKPGIANVRSIKITDVEIEN